MSLRKIVSTFVCFGLFGCFGCVSGMEKGNVIAVKEGAFKRGSSVMSYTLGITPSNSSGDINVMCHIQDSSQDSSGSDESGSLSCEVTYRIRNALWVTNTICVQEFVDKLIEGVNISNGKIPSYKEVSDLSKKMNNASGVLIIKDNGFAKITKDKFKKAKYVVFDGVTLNKNFVYHYYEMDLYVFDTIEFVGCTLKDGYWFSNILDGCNIKNLSIINSGLTKEDLDEILLRISPHILNNLNISNNNLDKSVIEVLQNRISGTFALDSLVLTGHNLEQEDVKQIGGVRNVII